MSAIYRGLYRATAQAAAWLAAARFRGHVTAVYLRRSLAMGLAIPGLSDIDLFFVLADELPPEAHERVTCFYRRLARLLPLLDRHAEAFPRGAIRRLHRENPGFRFRFLEGRVTWRLLHGRDVLADLADPSAVDVAVAHVFDLKTRLTYWNAVCLDVAPASRFGERRREYFLFKFLADLLGTAHYLATSAFEPRSLQLYQRFVSGHLSLGELVEPEAAAQLRGFAAHTLQHRLRRLFARDPATLWLLASRLLRIALLLLEQLYVAHGVATADVVKDEHAHFYRDGVFLPSGRRIEVLPEAALDHPDALVAAFARNRARGVDTGLRWRRFLVNLSHTDPTLGHSTVVAEPDTGDPLPPTFAAPALPLARPGLHPER